MSDDGFAFSLPSSREQRAPSKAPDTSGFSFELPSVKKEAAPAPAQKKPAVAATKEEVKPWMDYGADGGLGTYVDVASGLGRGMAKGVTGVADIPSLMQRGAMWAAEKAGLPAPKHPVIIPTGKEIMEKAGVEAPVLEEKAVGRPGKYAETVGEFLPFAGRGIAGKVKGALIPGAASETAGELAEGTPYEAPARVAGAIVGGGAAALPEALTGPRAARSLVTRATEGATEQQLNAAESLFNQARNIGIPITRAEALSFLTHGGTSLTDLQRVLEGKGGLREFMAERPTAVGEAAKRTFEEVGPELQAPQLVGPRVGEAARGEVAGAHAARTERARPFYEAAKAETVEPTLIGDVVGRIDEMVASDPSGATHGPLKDLREMLIATPAKAGKPATREAVTDPRTGDVIRYETTPSTPSTPETYVTDIGTLDRIRKYFRDRTELPAFAENAIDKETGAKINAILEDVNAAAAERSLPLRMGRRAYQEASRDIVEPLEAGPVGRLAKEDITTEQAAGALFPASPQPGSAEEVARTVRAIEGREPQAARDLIRSHLERTFNEKTQDLQAGAPQFGGANFVANIAGNRQQRENLLTAIEALPHGPQIRNGVETLFDVLQATGQRQRIGSQTTFNQEISDALKSGMHLEKLAPPIVVKNWVQGLAVGRNTEELARLLTDPAAAKDFRTLATAPKGTKAFVKSMSNLAARASQYSLKTAPSLSDKFSVSYGDKPARATGGRISRGMTANALISAVERARKAEQNTTKSILNHPDESVVHALKIAKSSI